VCGGVMLDGQDDHHLACQVDQPFGLYEQETLF
jgi:hypothetical protein